VLHLLLKPADLWINSQAFLESFVMPCVHVMLHPQVANYCVTKLAELNVPLSTHAVGLSPDSQQPPANGHQYLELTCNGLVGGGGRGKGGGEGGGGGRGANRIANVLT
jgi:hypothetical protein